MNLLNETGENSVSVYEDGYKEGFKDAISLIEYYEENEDLTFRSRDVLRTVLQVLRENVNNV